jgi:hypothetical protein
VRPVAGSRAIDRRVGGSLHDRGALQVQGPTEDPPHIRVDRPNRASERDRRDRPGRVRPDPRKSLERLDVVRDVPAVLVADRLGGSPQVDRPAVVAHPLPGAQHVGR